MTQEEKFLLLQDLSARLPYGVIVRHADSFVDNDGNETGEFWYKRGYLCDITTLDDMTTTIIESEGSDEEGYKHICLLERTVPYLRPMSSMTVEEKKNLLVTIVGDNGIKYFQVLSDGSIDNTGATIQDLNKFNMHWVSFDKDTVTLYLDWLNTNHFDYRGLIDKGLALEAPKGMYNLKENKI